MIQISYLSAATQPMSTQDLMSLLDTCLRRNTERGVTGMLLYGNETFLQALEGDEAVVEPLYETILTDPRHADVQLLRRKTIAHREYADWSMGFKRIAGATLPHPDAVLEFSDSEFTADFLRQHVEIAEELIDHYRQPHWEPLVEALDERDRMLKHLKSTLAHTRGCLGLATLVLEGCAEAGRGGTFGAAQARLCETALGMLRQV